MTAGRSLESRFRNRAFSCMLVGLSRPSSEKGMSVEAVFSIVADGIGDTFSVSYILAVELAVESAVQQVKTLSSENEGGRSRLVMSHTSS